MLEAYLFGSQARGDAGPLSDVDVAVYVQRAAIERPGFGIEAEIGSELQAALGRSDVDVVLLNRAPPLLYHRVLRDGVRLLSRSEPDTATREGQALSRHCDFVPQLLRRHLPALDQALGHLQAHVGRDIQQLEQDISERWTVERGLQLCVQNVLDIATHLSASAGHDVSDYASSIDQLGTLGILPAELARDLRPLAGFRNALVHGYLQVDVRRVHAVLNQHLGQLRDFARHIEAHLSRA